MEHSVILPHRYAFIGVTDYRRVFGLLADLFFLAVSPPRLSLREAALGVLSSRTPEPAPYLLHHQGTAGQARHNMGEIL